MRKESGPYADFKPLDVSIAMQHETAFTFSTSRNWSFFCSMMLSTLMLELNRIDVIQQLDIRKIRSKRYFFGVESDRDRRLSDRRL